MHAAGVKDTAAQTGHRRSRLPAWLLVLSRRHRIVLRSGCPETRLAEAGEPLHPWCNFVQSGVVGDCSLIQRQMTVEHSVDHQGMPRSAGSLAPPPDIAASRQAAT